MAAAVRDFCYRREKRKKSLSNGYCLLLAGRKICKESVNLSLEQVITRVSVCTMEFRQVIDSVSLVIDVILSGKSLPVSICLKDCDCGVQSCCDLAMVSW